MTSFIDTLRPSGKSFALVFDFLSIIGGSLFIALLSQISIHLGFTPVPVTLQSLAVLLIGALLGSKRGALAVASYIFEGLIGFPVFAGGCYGYAQVIGPTGGYLFGFIIAAWIVGSLLEKGWKENFGRTLVALLIGNSVIYMSGVIVLSVYVGGFKNALLLGVLPFILGDILKTFIATSLIPCGWKFVRYFQP